MFKPLSFFAEIHYGRSPNEVLVEESNIPIIGTGGAYGFASRALFKGPAVVVPRKGSLGNPQYIETPFWPVDTTFALIPKINVNPRWLYCGLLDFDLTKLNEATGVPSISREWLQKIPIRYFTFEEQNRFALKVVNLDVQIENTQNMVRKLNHLRAGIIQKMMRPHEA